MNVRTTKQTLAFSLAATLLLSGCSGHKMQEISRKIDERAQKILVPAGEIFKSTAGTIVATVVGDVAKTCKKQGGTAGIACEMFLSGISESILNELSDDDVDALNSDIDEVLMTGQPQSWVNTKSKVRIQTQVTQTTVQPGAIKNIPVDKSLGKMPPLELVGKKYQTLTALRVRSGPGTDFKIQKTLGAGEKIDVVAKVVDQPWVLMSTDGVGTGFVSSQSKYITPTQVAALALPAGSSTPNIKTVPTSTQKICKQVESKIELPNGDSTIAKRTVCKGANGWKS